MLYFNQFLDIWKFGFLDRWSLDNPTLRFCVVQRCRVFHCKRFAQSAGPWFGHRFAQSAGPRSPLRSVRCDMEICCISQHLYYPFALFCEFRTLFGTVFVLWGHFWRTWGTLLLFKMKKGHLGTPIVIFSAIKSTFATHFEVCFLTFSKKMTVSQVSFFSVVSQSHF